LTTGKGGHELFVYDDETRIHDIHAFATLKFGFSHANLLFMGKSLPEDSSERWIDFNRRMGYSGENKIFVVPRRFFTEPAPAPVVPVDFTVLALDGAVLRRRATITLRLGSNDGSTIHRAFKDFFKDAYYNIISVGLRRADVADVLHVGNTHVFYDVDEQSHFFVIVHPEAARTGGRSRAKHSRSYRH